MAETPACSSCLSGLQAMSTGGSPTASPSQDLAYLDGRKRAAKGGPGPHVIVSGTVNQMIVGCATMAQPKMEQDPEIESPDTKRCRESEDFRQDMIRKSYAAGDVSSLVKYHEVIDLDKDVPHEPEAVQGLGGDYIKSFVFGGLDGIVSTFALVAGLGGANATLTTLIAVGLAKVIADAFSMGFGEFTSATAELENALIVKRREEWETENYEEGEVKEMAALYMEKGVSKVDALTMLTIMAHYKDLFVEHMMVMEHGMLPPDDSDIWQPVKQGVVCFVAFVVFGMVPLVGFIIVYLIDPGAASQSDNAKTLSIAYGLTVVTLFVMGLTKAKLTGSPKWLQSGTLMVINGSVAGGIAFLIGDVLTHWLDF